MRRVGLLLAALMLCSLPAPAQEARIYQGGSGDALSAAPGQSVSLFAARLGDVSAMVLAEDGTIFTADRSGGRIIRITDRTLDGEADIVQQLPFAFDQPSGLALSGGSVFVADREGLWRLAGGGKSLTASFANANSTGGPHPLAVLLDGRLWLGLPVRDGSARLLAVDLQTGVADLIGRTSGRITGFVANDAGTPLILLQRGGETYLGSTLETLQKVDGPISALRIEAQSGAALLSTPDGVFRATATFAGLGGTREPLLDGFGARTPPGGIATDARGVFVSDGPGGRLWRITDAPEVEITATPQSEEVQDAAKPARPVLPRGSAIGRASTLPEAEGPQPTPRDEDG